MEKYQKTLEKAILYIPLGILMAVINANFMLNTGNLSSFINKPTAWIISIGFSIVMVYAIDTLKLFYVLLIGSIEAVGMHVFLKFYKDYDQLIASIYFAVYYFTALILAKLILDKRKTIRTEKEQLNTTSYITTNTQLISQLNELKNELASLKIAHQITGHNYTSAQVQNSELSKHLAELTVELETRNDELNKLIPYSQNNDCKCLQLERTNEELSNKIKELETTCNKLSINNRELYQEVEKYKNWNKELIDKRDQLLESNIELKNKIVEFNILNDHKEAYADLHKKMKQGGNPERIAATEAIINLLN